MTWRTRFIPEDIDETLVGDEENKTETADVGKEDGEVQK